MDYWCWLNTNSGALQSLFAIIGAVLTLVTIGVLAVTWKAIRRQAMASELQAVAARALTTSAEAQTQAATEAAEMAKKANALSVRQLTGQAMPILVLTRDPERLAGYADKANYLIQNQGPGAAQDVSWHYEEIVR